MTDSAESADTAGERTATDGGDERRMRDVSHTPPHGEGTNGIWTRGDDGEGDAPGRGPTDDE